MDYSWKELAQMLMAETNPQTNYHGTPYTFNRFDDSKFLTGEGNMVHGPGHYSADLFNTAKKYKEPSVSVLKDGKEIERKLLSPNFVDRLKDSKANHPDIFKTEYEYELGRTKNTLDKTLAKFNKGSLYYKQLIERLKTELDFLENMDRYKTIRSEGNLYKVNVPNEYFMWKEGLPLREQSPFIRDAWYRNNYNFGKLLDLWSIDHDLEGIRLPKDHKFWKLIYKNIDLYGSDYIRPSIRKIFSNQMQALDLPDQLKFLIRSNNLDKLSEAVGDIRGIRAIGNTDGPINVTFSGNNIRMANTPWQRIINRIPTRTIGMIGRKIMATPGVQPTLKFLGRTAVPLAILEGLTSPVSNDIEGMNNYNAVRGLPLQGGIKYYGD